MAPYSASVPLITIKQPGTAVGQVVEGCDQWQPNTKTKFKLPGDTS